MRGVGGVRAGEGVDAVQAVGEGAHAQCQSAGGLGGHASRVEVRGQGVEERLGSTAGLFERAESAAYEVHEGLPVAGQDGKDQQVGGVQERVVDAHALGDVEGLRALPTCGCATSSWRAQGEGPPQHLRRLAPDEATTSATIGLTGATNGMLSMTAEGTTEP
ncbi:hypothetical protein SAMN05216482_8748 [Streptomyces sp. PAN_FS17]|nr:hypothetical protein SAMN05216482_8748 [Streptomyces sp. PAN_FS17]